MPKRLPPGFPAGQANQNFLQGQVPSTAPGTAGNSGAPQLQTSQNVQHTGLTALGHSSAFSIFHLVAHDAFSCVPRVSKHWTPAIYRKLLAGAAAALWV